MKRLIIRLLSFTVFLIVFLFVIIGMTGRYGPEILKKNIKNKRAHFAGHMFTRMNDLRTTGNVDVLVIGSSHVYRGFDPRIFKRRGITIFNLGSSAQTPLQTEILVKRHALQLQPKMVIFEVFPGVFSNDGVESSLDILANCHINLQSIMMAFRINNLLTWNALFAQGFSKLLFRETYSEPECKATECYVKGGFVQRKEIENFKGERPGAILQWKFRGEQVRAFRRTLDFLKENKIPTILLQAPIGRVMYDSYTNNAEVDEFYRSSGLHYYNMNTSAIGTNNEYFYDRDHLNLRGVRQFNKLVLNVLREAHHMGNKKRTP